MAKTTTSIYDIDAETLKKIERLSAEYAAKNAKAEGAGETYRLAMELLDNLAGRFDARKSCADHQVSRTKNEKAKRFQDGQSMAYAQAAYLVRKVMNELYERA